MLISVNEYLSRVEIKPLLASLAPGSADLLLRQVEHFTLSEAERRDEIVLGYFGKQGFEGLAGVMAEGMSAGSFSEAPAVLDIGSGVGTFTIPIISRVKRVFPKARFYAMDATPAMLSELARKSDDILPFVGVAENVSKSVREAREHLKVPEKFDAIISTLTLHHCPDIDRVFESVGGVLADKGRVVIADLCKHPFSEFKEEMGDYHLGFEPEVVRSTALRYFRKVDVGAVPGLCCSSSGRSAQLFVLTMER